MIHKFEDYSLNNLLKHLRAKDETHNMDKCGQVGFNVHMSTRGSGQKGKNSSRTKKAWNPRKISSRN